MSMRRRAKRNKAKKAQAEARQLGEGARRWHDLIDGKLAAGDYAGVINTFAEAVKENVYDAGLFYDAAYAYFMLGDYTRAATWAQHTIEQDGRNVPARILLARICLLADREQDAFALFDFVLKNLAAALDEEQQDDIRDVLDYYARTEPATLAAYPALAKFLGLADGAADGAAGEAFAPATESAAGKSVPSATESAAGEAFAPATESAADSGPVPETAETADGSLAPAADSFAPAAEPATSLAPAAETAEASFAPAAERTDAAKGSFAPAEERADAAKGFAPAEENAASFAPAAAERADAALAPESVAETSTQDLLARLRAQVQKELHEAEEAPAAASEPAAISLAPAAAESEPAAISLSPVTPESGAAAISLSPVTPESGAAAISLSPVPESEPAAIRLSPATAEGEPAAGTAAPSPSAQPAAEPSVSVIVPIYNAGKYLRECLDGIAAQTLGNFEVLLVDDASTDDSFRVAEKYARENGWHLVALPEDVGPGVARNAGLARARGRYVAFVDADDTVGEHYLEELFEAAEREQADVVVAGMREWHEDAAGRRTEEKDLPACAKEELLPANLAARLDRALGKDVTFPAMVPYARLVRRGFLTAHDLSFAPLRRFEDTLFNLPLLALAERYLLIPAISYGRRHHAASITGAEEKKGPNEYLDAILSAQQIFADWAEREKLDAAARLRLDVYIMNHMTTGLLAAMPTLEAAPIVQAFAARNFGEHRAFVELLLLRYLSELAARK